MYRNTSFNSDVSSFSMCIKSLHYKAKLYVRVLRYLGTNVMGTQNYCTTCRISKHLKCQQK